MIEVFKKELLTSREFPVIFMAAQGLLFFKEGELVHVPQVVAEVCLDLRERGYRLGIISNWRISLHALLRDHMLLDFFESVIVSSDCGAEKPNAKIFSTALEDLSVSARESVFVGPSFTKDIEGARGSGMRAILYDPELKELKTLGMKEPQSQDSSQVFPGERAAHSGDDNIVDLNDLRFQKKLEGVMVIRRFEELLEIFQ